MIIGIRNLVLIRISIMNLGRFMYPEEIDILLLFEMLYLRIYVMVYFSRFYLTEFIWVVGKR